MRCSLTPDACVGVRAMVPSFQIGVGAASEIALIKDLLEYFDIFVACFGVLLPVGADQTLDPIEDRRRQRSRL
jgi:hypothetical protein